VNTLVACDFFTKNVIMPLGVRAAYCVLLKCVGRVKYRRLLGGLLRHSYRAP